MSSERQSFLLSVGRRLDVVDTELAFVEDAAATLDLPFEFGEARRQLSELRAHIKELLTNG